MRYGYWILLFIFIFLVGGAVGVVESFALDTVQGDTYMPGEGPNSIYINGGIYNNLTIEKPNLQLVTRGRTKIYNLEIKEEAQNAIIELGNETVVNNLIIEAEAAIKGRGLIEKAEVRANGVTFETAPKDQSILSTLTTPPVILSRVDPKPPKSSASKTSEPEIPEPETPEPEVSEPETPNPEISEPETPEPEIPVPPEITETGTIKGLVTDANDYSGLPNVFVAVYQVDGRTQIHNSLEVTNENGEYSIDGIEAGRGYIVKFTKEGYQEGEEGDIEVKNNKITIVNKELHPLSSDKEITDFRFAELVPEVVGEIDKDTQTINLVVPYNTDITKLVPSIDYIGVSLDPASGESQDFTNPIIYTVTAEDNSEIQYVAIVTLASPPKIGDKVYQSIDVVTFGVVLAPQATFLNGRNSTAYVTRDFWIADTEVTYQLWHKVYTWALENGYSFYNQGAQGNDGGVGVEPTDRKKEPVTSVNWYDVIAWCNALTEYYNHLSSSSLEPVYIDQNNKIIRNVFQVDLINIQEKTQAKGFRLPTSNEWELAARYQGENQWTPSTYASGATAFYRDENATSAVAWYDTSKTHQVAQKLSNTLGLYDMSGNVWEWTFTTFSDQSKKVIRGGAYNNTNKNSSGENLQTGQISELAPGISSHNLGFRFVRTAE
ncbi:MAG: SUMF1/EgtB/PvdO family nonheme iron enzyme [Clostridia bacterium]|nr:SUMF1/EgtB/PvdO family nonheme iron enzyme [Clostridia bacterium]